MGRRTRARQRRRMWSVIAIGAVAGAAAVAAAVWFLREGDPLPEDATP